MSNRKRVTLTFEIDDHVGFNDEAFMRRDFLQELVCCVNDPYADTFVMKVEDADAPQDMSAREFFPKWAEICATYLPDDCYHCPLYLMTPPRSCMRLMITDAEQAISIVEEWAREHPDKRGEE